MTVPAESPSTSLSWMVTFPNIYLLLEVKPAPENVQVNINIGYQHKISNITIRENIIMSLIDFSLEGVKDHD